MVEAIVNSAELTAAFKRLREHWKRLFEGPPDSARERTRVLEQIDADLNAVTAAARVSDEGRTFVEIAFRVRLGEWRVPGAGHSLELVETAEAVRSGFEMRLRTLRQMEAGDEVLPPSGRDIRRSAARDICFFHRLRTLSTPDGNAADHERREPREVDLSRLSQCFDNRRKMVREEIEVPSAAVEAVEFLVRLGASG